MMKRTILYLLLILLTSLFSTLPVSAQRRQIGDARTLLKSGKDFDKAEKLMTDLLKDSSNLDNTRIYDIWLQAVEKQYDELNQKLYKKEAVDTAALFTLTQRIFTVAERLDSIDSRPDRKGHVSPEYRRDNATRLLTYRPNLFYGGTYHLRKGDFMTAYGFFETFIDCTRQPLFSDVTLPVPVEAAYWATYCGYRLGEPLLTLRYQKQARQDSAKLDYTLQYVAEAWQQLGDDDSYLQTLREGFHHFPKSTYFFPRLMDASTARGNYLEALRLADEALASDPHDTLFLFAKSTLLLNMGLNDESLAVSRQLIDTDPTQADAYYNAGTACLNLILDMDSRQQKRQIRQLYQQAQQYMETYRKMSPGAQDKWAPALYRIYFNLNLGKQFDEIDKILKK